MIFSKSAVAGIVAVSLGTMSSAAQAVCKNEVWNKVMASGTLIVGVKADNKPWGYRNIDSSIVGMEIDIAQAAADAMGVDLETVAVQASNRMQFLEQGKIDLLIATMSDRVDRRAKVGIVQPNYYTSGTNIMAPKALDFKDWEDLRGKSVCGREGAFYNATVTKRYGVEVIAFTGNAEAKQALRDGKCVAWVYDDSSIVSDLSSNAYDDFEMPLVSEDENPWGLAVPLAEKECIFGNFMSGLTFNMHQSGELLELEEKWGIQASQFLKKKNKQYSDWLSN